MNQKLLEKIIHEEIRKKLREGLEPDLEQKIMDVLMSTARGVRMGPDRLARTAKDLALIMQSDPEFQKNWFRVFKPSYDEDIRGNFNADQEDSYKPKRLKEMAEDGLEKRIYNTLSSVGSHGEEYAKSHTKSLAAAIRRLPGHEQILLSSVVAALESYQNEQDFFADNPGLEDEDPARKFR